MKHALTRRLLSGVSLIAVTAFASSAAFAAETFNAGPNAARTINANTDSIDVNPGAVVLTDSNGDSIVVAPGVSVIDPTAQAVTINNGTLLGTFVNNGVITGGNGVDEDAIFILGGSQLLGGFVNNGAVTGAGDGFDLNDSTMAGGLLNTSVIQAGILNLTSAAVEIQNSSFVGGVTNTGQLLGEAGIRIVAGSQFAGGIDNRSSGLIQGDGSQGILITGAGTTFDGGIKNAGVISGGEGGYGIFINNGLFEDDIHNLDGASIVGDANVAVVINATTFNGDFVNDGLVKSTGNDALTLGGATFNGGIVNTGNIAAFGAGATGILLNTTTFTGGINNDGGTITADAIGIHVNTAVPGGILTSGDISAPIAIDINDSSAAPIITQTGGRILGNVRMCDCGPSTFVGKDGYFAGVISSPGSQDDLLVQAGPNGEWTAEGSASLMNLIRTESGTGVFGGKFRGDLAGTGFDTADSSVFATTAGRAYLDDESDFAVSQQLYGGEGSLEFLFKSNEAVYGSVASATSSLDGRLAAYLDWNSFRGQGVDQDFFYDNVLTSTAAFVGAFDNEGDLDVNSIFFVGKAERNGANTLMDIRIHRIGFDELLAGPTANQAALGGALEGIFAQGTTAFDNLEDPAGNGLQNPQTSNEGLFSALFQAESPTEYAAMLSTLDGHFFGALFEATFNINDQFDESLRTRLQGVHWGRGAQRWAARDDVKYASTGVIATDAAASSVGGNPGVVGGRGPWSLWARGAVQGAEHDADGDIEGFDQDTSLLGGGIDYAFSPTTLLGVAAQFADSEIDFDPLFTDPTKSDIESWQIAGYWSQGIGMLYIDVVGSATFNDYDNTRFDFWLNPITSSFDSTVLSIYGELGTVLGGERGLRFQPFAGVGFRSIDADDFSESCDLWCLTIADNDEVESLYTQLGFAISEAYRLGSTSVVPEIRAAWVHEFSDDRQTFTGAFIGAPDFPFVIEGGEFAQDRFNVGANLTAGITPGMELYFGYRYTGADDFDAHTGTAGVRVAF